MSNKTKFHFEEGEQVKVIDGAFDNFVGTIEKINEETHMLTVMVVIFGRNTPIQLGYHEVEKI